MKMRLGEAWVEERLLAGGLFEGVIIRGGERILDGGLCGQREIGMAEIPEENLPQAASALRVRSTRLSVRSSSVPCTQARWATGLVRLSPGASVFFVSQNVGKLNAGSVTNPS